jgi:hypothetical protein
VSPLLALRTGMLKGISLLAQRDDRIVTNKQHDLTPERPNGLALGLWWDTNHACFIEPVLIAKPVDLFKCVHRRIAFDGDCSQRIPLANDVSLAVGTTGLLGDG